MQESSRFHTLVINERLNSEAKSGDAAFEVGDGDGQWSKHSQAHLVLFWSGCKVEESAEVRIFGIVF